MSCPDTHNTVLLLGAAVVIPPLMQVLKRYAQELRGAAAVWTVFLLAMIAVFLTTPLTAGVVELTANVLLVGLSAAGIYGISRSVFGARLPR